MTSHCSACLRVVCDDVLDGHIGQQEVSVLSFESVVLVLEFLEVLHVRHRQSAVLGFLLVVRGRASTILPPDLVDGATGIGLFQNGHNLRLDELRLAPGTLWLR